jgi:hypothetical protein
MFENEDSLEEMFRSMARELSQSVERAMEQVDVDEIAGAIGVDPDRAREWVDTAGSWLRQRTETLGDELVFRAAPTPRGPRESAPASDDPLSSAGPHPLDLPTEEQGRALAALASGRWSVEPGTNALSARADGPGPSDALGLVRELRVRDWIAADGEVTLAGRNALRRWLEAGNGGGHQS